MQSRRAFLVKIGAAFGVMGLVVGKVIADEILGVITKIDIEGKKITVEEKDTDKKVELKITDETKQVSKKGEREVDLEKLDGYLKKTQDAGKKGISAKITYEKGVASKIEIQRKKASQ